MSKARDPNGFLLDNILSSDGKPSSEGMTPQERQGSTNKRGTGEVLVSDPGVQSLMGKGLDLEITHVPTGKTLVFAAFITSFDDKYTASWGTTEAYGRMDTMPVYQSTRRSLSLAWEVPSFSTEEAKHNFKKLGLLEKFLYPEFEAGGLGATTIKSPPLLRVKFANLIMNADNGGGLLGYVGGFNTAPDLEAGFHVEGAMMYPKVFALSMDLTVLHEHDLGWSNKKFRGGSGGFPYGVQDGTEPKASVESQDKKNAPSQVQEARNNQTLAAGGAMNPGSQAFNS